MTFKLSARSRAKLVGVHPDLVRVVERAIQISEVDFAVTCGTRTLAEQEALLKAGATTTLKSRHLGGFAVDLAAFIGTRLSWEARLYHKIKDAMFAAAAELKIPIRWGGDWNCNGDSNDESFFDGPHFELPRGKRYP